MTSSRPAARWGRRRGVDTPGLPDCCWTPARRSISATSSPTTRRCIGPPRRNDLRPPSWSCCSPAARMPNAEGGQPVDNYLGVAQTPLMLARKRGDTPIVRALLKAGAKDAARPGSDWQRPRSRPRAIQRRQNRGRGHPAGAAAADEDGRGIRLHVPSACEQAGLRLLSPATAPAGGDQPGAFPPFHDGSRGGAPPNRTLEKVLFDRPHQTR